MSLAGSAATMASSLVSQRGMISAETAFEASGYCSLTIQSVSSIWLKMLTQRHRTGAGYSCKEGEERQSNACIAVSMHRQTSGWEMMCSRLGRMSLVMDMSPVSSMEL